MASCQVVVLYPSGEPAFERALPEKTNAWEMQQLLAATQFKR